MRRSAHPRVRSEGEVLFEDASLRAQLVNLSRGGLCARGALPARVIDGVEQRPAVLRVLLGVEAGVPPIAAEARVAWVRDEAAPEQTFGLSFLELGNDARARLDALIAAQLGDAPPASPAVRLKLSSGPVLRAVAESIDAEGAVLGAELPWLRVGSSLEAEIDGQWVDARPTAISLDIDASGTPRLRLRVAFTPRVQRRDDTLPYFFAGSDTPASVVRAELDAILEGEEEAWARDKMVAANAEPPRMAFTPPGASAQQRGLALVRKALQRRVRLAMARVLIVILLAVAGALAWRALHKKIIPVAVDIPADVRPVVAAPAPKPLVENERDPVVDETEATGAAPEATAAAKTDADTTAQPLPPAKSNHFHRQRVRAR